MIGGVRGVMLYHYINPFNLFVPYFKPILILVAIVIFLISSVFIYRPFCRLICPFGLLSWLFETISIFRIRIDNNKCVKCKLCDKVCPTGAAGDKVDQKKIVADCFSCGRCLEKCSKQAIKYDC